MLIGEGAFTPPVLVFVQSILRAKELATELLFDGINADCIHADRTAHERDDIVKGFAEGRIWCLIATDVMGRGVDFKGVKLVINYDFPQSAGSYIHRIGKRAAERCGDATLQLTLFPTSFDKVAPVELEKKVERSLFSPKPTLLISKRTSNRTLLLHERDIDL